MTNLILKVKPQWLDVFIRQNKFGRTRDRDPPPTHSFERTTIDARGGRIGNEKMKNGQARPRMTGDARALSIEGKKGLDLKLVRGKKRLDLKDVNPTTLTRAAFENESMKQETRPV